MTWNKLVLTLTHEKMERCNGPVLFAKLGWKQGWKSGLRDLGRFYDLPSPDAQRRPRIDQIPGPSESDVSDPFSPPIISFELSPSLKIHNALLEFIIKIKHS